MNLIRCVETAAKLEECRRSAKFLLGEKYAEVVGKWAHALRAVATRDGISTLVAATRAAKQTSDGFAQIIILAAAVELAETSEEQPT